MADLQMFAFSGKTLANLIQIDWLFYKSTLPEFYFVGEWVWNNTLAGVTLPLLKSLSLTSLLQPESFRIPSPSKLIHIWWVLADPSLANPGYCLETFASFKSNNHWLRLSIPYQSSTPKSIELKVIGCPVTLQQPFIPALTGLVREHLCRCFL
jgi:hypothetical protein